MFRQENGEQIRQSISTDHQVLHERKQELSFGPQEAEKGREIIHKVKRDGHKETITKYNQRTCDAENSRRQYPCKVQSYQRRQDVCDREATTILN